MVDGGLMNIIGIIAEYNPFHNGHIYHINKIKEMYPDSLIVLVMSSSFTQRGLPSIIDKWSKTKIALNYGIDLVIELPFPYSTQSSDIFASGSISILKHLKVDKLVFGSEDNNIEKLKELASIQLNNLVYQDKVKDYLEKGYNYPTSMSKALSDITDFKTLESNDLLGLSYIKEIIKQDALIEPISIKRTNNYLSKSLEENISSATSIRDSLKNNIDITNCVPKETIDALNKNMFFLEDYFNLFKYKVHSSKDLTIYLDVDEGIENRIIKYIDDADNMNDFIELIKTKRYTYNKICRMIIHILCSYTKEENKKLSINYIRVLGFSKNGRNYLSKIKKDIKIPLLTKYENILDNEKRITSIYSSILDYKLQNEMIEAEYKNKVIIK